MSGLNFIATSIVKHELKGTSQISLDWPWGRGTHSLIYIKKKDTAYHLVITKQEHEWICM